MRQKQIFSVNVTKRLVKGGRFAITLSNISEWTDVSEAKCVVDSPRAIRGPWLRLVAARIHGHKPGKYAGSSYAKKQIAGEKKTAFKERNQTRLAEQHSDQTDRALPAIPSGLMGMYLLTSYETCGCMLNGRND